MSQKSIWISIILGIMLGFFIYISLSSKNIKDPSTYTRLEWYPDETISINYDECKALNTSLPIKRVFKKDYRLPMCPQNYVVLYDQSQNIVFKFNENNNENPKILTIDVSCDNSTDKC